MRCGLKISPLSANERIMIEDVTERCSIYVKDKFPGQLEISFSKANFFKFIFDVEEKSYKLLVSKFYLKPSSVSEKDWNLAKDSTGKKVIILSEKLKDKEKPL